MNIDAMLEELRRIRREESEQAFTDSYEATNTMSAEPSTKKKSIRSLKVLKDNVYVARRVVSKNMPTREQIVIYNASQNLPNVIVK